MKEERGRLHIVVFQKGEKSEQHIRHLVVPLLLAHFCEHQLCIAVTLPFDQK